MYRRVVVGLATRAWWRSRTAIVTELGDDPPAGDALRRCRSGFLEQEAGGRLPAIEVRG